MSFFCVYMNHVCSSWSSEVHGCSRSFTGARRGAALHSVPPVLLRASMYVHVAMGKIEVKCLSVEASGRCGALLRRCNGQMTHLSVDAPMHVRTDAQLAAATTTH